MSEFDDRERAEETRFQHEQELEFKAQARRAKLVGLWAAELMGLSGAGAEDYAKAVVLTDMEKAGSDDIFRKIRADLDLQSVQLSDHQIRAKMEECLALARTQVRDGV